MDTGIQLGRRFRALKLWMVMRHFGADGLRARIAEHIRLAQVFAGRVADSPDFELLAPVPFSVVCFRAVRRDGSASGDESGVDLLNQRILDMVNRGGEVFLSHTRLNGVFAIRLAIGNLRTTEDHIGRAWELLQTARREASRLH